MPNLVSGGTVSVEVFKSYAKTVASFYIAPPFDGEIQLPFIPSGTVYDLTVTQNNAVLFETVAMNIREFACSPAKNSVTLSKRIDGCLILNLTEISGDCALEVKITCISHLKKNKNCTTLTFPSGWGDELIMDVSIKAFGHILKIDSPTHPLSVSHSETESSAKLKADINRNPLIIEIYSNESENGSVLVSRRLFGDNLAFCTFTPKLSEAYENGEFLIEPVGGLETAMDNQSISLESGKSAYCFIRHRVIPPKGIRIKSHDGHFSEEIYFEDVSTALHFIPVELLHTEEIVKNLEEKMKTAPYEERCLIRDEINDICIKTKTVMGDIALVCIADGKASGLISAPPIPQRDNGYFLNENMMLDENEISELILNSQTTDGVIADIWAQDEHTFVFSTAVCLIALYLCKGSEYEKFAKRSLNYISGKDGYWAKTALALWNNEKIDFDELSLKSDMKIMYQQLDELAVSLIKNHRRK